jgi:hypothetical protein
MVEVAEENESIVCGSDMTFESWPKRSHSWRLLDEDCTI